MEYDISCVEEVASTNFTVKQWGKEGKPEGSVLIAHAQTAGRGRLGRSFYSPKGTGVYFSMLLRPQFPPEQITYLTPMAAVAMAIAMEQMGFAPKIKWVNDIFVNDKKVCGILCESAYPDYIVVGVGVNLAPPKKGFPEELSHIAGSLWDREPTNQQREQLLNTFFQVFAELYRSFDVPCMLNFYRTHNLLLGITVTAGGITGKVTGIGEDFSLLIEDEQGIHGIATGEARVQWR